MNIATVYEAVTRSIIAELEQGATPWVKPWKGGNRTGILPANAITGRCYSGINIPILWHAADVRGYPTNSWLTFKQALEKSACVRKGEKGTQVVFTKRLSVKKDDDADEQRQISMLRAFTVFNVAQVEGLAVPDTASALPPPAGAADAFAAATGADIRHGGDKAFFVPSMDFIVLPDSETFVSVEHFHATKLHELVHWSGHEKRLNRDLKNRFGTKALCGRGAGRRAGRGVPVRAPWGRGAAAPRRLHRQLAVTSQRGRPRDLHGRIESEHGRRLSALVFGTGGGGLRCPRENMQCMSPSPSCAGEPATSHGTVII